MHTQLSPITRNRTQTNIEITGRSTWNIHKNNPWTKRPQHTPSKLRYSKKKSFNLNIILFCYDRTKSMDAEGETEKKRMRHENGEEAKGTRPHEADNTQGERKLTALNYYENMQLDWQIRRTGRTRTPIDNGNAHRRES